MESNYFLGMALRDFNRVRSALDQGVPVDAPLFGRGATALLWAAGSGREDLLDLLLKRGATVDAEDWEGLTPLRIAIQCGHVDIVRTLLERGANPLRRFPSRPTILEEAKESRNEKIIELVKQAVKKQLSAMRSDATGFSNKS